MNRSGIVHLRSDAVSVVIDACGTGLPAVVHWGAPLPGLEPADLAAAVAALAAPPPSATLDALPPVGVLPEHSSGFPGRPGLRGHRDGADWTASFTLTDIVTTGDAGTVEFHAQDRTAGLALVSELELIPAGLLRMRHRVRNDGTLPYTLDGLEAALPVPAQARELLDFTGRHCRERQPQRHPFVVGSWVRESRRGRTGHDATLGLVAGTPGFGFRHGEVWALHLAWSGNHVSYAERLPEGHSRLGGGELLLPGEIVLAPGQEYATPWICAAYSARGIDGISAAFHGWMRSRAHHPGPDRPRPVILNTWEAVYFDHDLDKLRALADTAAAVGVERFVLDDGWFRHRRDDTAGLGDWYVDESVWPKGLHPLVDHVRGLGMEFGLWFEPEMVNPDSDLFRAHPGWLLAPDGRTPPEGRNQHVLDLANPEVFAYLLERLDALLTEYDIAYIKWDHNRDLVDAEHAGRPGVNAQTRALYRLLDELRARHPAVEIESCASGGARVDLGILEHTDRVWTSDCNDALERQTIQRWTGVFVPPELMGTHIGPTRSHSTGRTHTLQFRAATALFGHFGIEWDIASATDEDRAGLARTIAHYKDLRGLLHSGDVVRADHPDDAVWVHGVVSPDRTQALFAYAHLAASAHAVPVPVRLPGLDPERRYRVTVVHPTGTPDTSPRPEPAWYADGTTTLTGRLLEQVGLQPPICWPEQAWLLSVTAAQD